MLAFYYLYGVLEFVLLSVWLPTFLVAIITLAIRGVKLKYLNQASVGRIIAGDSGQKVVAY